MNNQKYITVAYKLYTFNEETKEEVLIEEATAEHPLQFISDMGTMLPDFEQQVKDLSSKDTFDFVLEAEQAYGEYYAERVVELDKNIFCVNGHFDKENIYEGNVIPLVNEDGNRFEGVILEIKETVVVVDLNHPLAGKKLHFKGEVVTSRPATDEELKALIERLSNHGGCGCNSDCGCDSSCTCGCQEGEPCTCHTEESEEACCGKGCCH